MLLSCDLKIFFFFISLSICFHYYLVTPNASQKARVDNAFDNTIHIKSHETIKNFTQRTELHEFKKQLSHKLLNIFLPYPGIYFTVPYQKQYVKTAYWIKITHNGTASVGTCHSSLLQIAQLTYKTITEPSLLRNSMHSEKFSQRHCLSTALYFPTTDSDFITRHSNPSKKMLQFLVQLKIPQFLNIKLSYKNTVLILLTLLSNVYAPYVQSRVQSSIRTL